VRASIETVRSAGALPHLFCQGIPRHRLTVVVQAVVEAADTDSEVVVGHRVLLCFPRERGGGKTVALGALRYWAGRQVEQWCDPHAGFSRLSNVDHATPSFRSRSTQLRGSARASVETVRSAGALPFCDRLNNALRHEGQRSEISDVTLDLVLALRDFVEGRRSTFNAEPCLLVGPAVRENASESKDGKIGRRGHAWKHPYDGAGKSR
jgi:hypothetical protein